jgi:beta-alanine--pyruvate transaminase
MGVLVRYTGDSLAFSPPLIVSEDQIDEIFNTVKKAIHMVA